MLKILLYSTESSRINPYVKELELVFRNLGIDPLLSTENFWNKTGDFQAILFQWPEELFNWQIPTRKELEELEKNLIFWSKRSKIIITRHNIEPHVNSNDKNYHKLYELMYSYADTVVHLGEFSRNEYLEKYARKEFISTQNQEVIPHPLYTTIKNSILKKEARSRLNLPGNRKIILVFGRIRNEEELDLVKRTFSKLNKKDYFLVVSHYPLPVFRGSVKLRPLMKYFLSNRLNQRRYFGGIPEDNIQDFINSSDLLFIPRIDTLNSGNVFLGFTFRKPIVGPNITNIGEVLAMTDNQTFDPANDESAVEAIEKSFLNNSEPEHIATTIEEKYPTNIAIGKKYLALFKGLL